MLSVEDKIVTRINRIYHNAAFTNSDFWDLAPAATVDWNLHQMKNKGLLRSVLRGIYDRPRHGKLLSKELPPDLAGVARAVARKNQWHIQVSGSAALNFLGLSEQVPTATVYHSDGPNKEYTVGGRVLRFRHVRLRESKFARWQSEIIVQALQELGEGHITDATVAQIRAWLPAQERRRVSRDTLRTAEWVRAKIALICREGEENG